MHEHGANTRGSGVLDAGIGETMTGEWLESAGEDGAAIVDAFTGQ